jgi:hypothetical protein
MRDESDGTPDFEQAFAPFTHQLFPDGCPDHKEDLSLIWPSRTDRSAVSAKQAESSEARSSITEIRRVASLSGLTQRQRWGVTLAACDCWGGQPSFGWHMAHPSAFEN